MKKIVAVVLMLIVMVGCSSSGNSEGNKSSDKQTVSSDTSTSSESIDKETTSQVVSTTLYSESLGLDWNYSIYLPPTYEDEDNLSQYPVLFLLHGAYGNHRNIVERFPIQEQLDGLIDSGKLEEIIVVFVDGFNSFYLNGPTLNMEDAIVKDLIPYIDSTYRVKEGRENRSIGGISMGGYGSANLALSYPNLFSNALLISPAVWEKMTKDTVTSDWILFKDDNDKIDNEKWTSNYPLTKLESYSEQDDEVNFFIITGDEDEVVPIGQVEIFKDRLEEVAPVEFVVEKDGIHGWKTWEDAMQKALEFLGKEQGQVK